MQVFETILVLLLGAAVVSSFAKRVNIPYPVLLAVGGALLACLPNAPKLDFPPDLVLVLFVAPVLMDAAFDTSLRDLRAMWLPVLSLVLAAVVLTTVAVAFAARWLFPDMPWAAAVALGALLAPPDAVAATTILRKLPVPLRMRMVLEGESLLNDASALLIYKVAVGAVVAGEFHAADAVPMFVLVVFGSAIFGLALTWPISRIMRHFEEAPSAVIFQFGLTFGIWLLSERLRLSPIVAVVTFALAMSRLSTRPMQTHIRTSSFPIWETATVVLNVLAFTLVGLQLGPILEKSSAGERLHSLGLALVILAVVIAVRLGWVFVHHLLVRLNAMRSERDGRKPGAPATLKGAVVIGWSGMRGIVTLAAAMALPAGFPYRDFIQLTAFVVVLGTLVIQGLTLRPLLKLVRLPSDGIVQRELQLARTTAIRAAMDALPADDTPTSRRLRDELAAALEHLESGAAPGARADNVLRRCLVAQSRHAVQDLRLSGAIGDDAYRQVEAELDWVELSAGEPE
ncbi:sodium:proton antiporter [Dyella marensis]|jgi:CPA1 family monovalent cation:H+ antiporter|uniref:Monovalent cation:H+ antiporter, CPA1 family n=1 Tax=Dyella marensis TaxID=500610 RepID=A0A1I1Z8H7_9GAMM|nr:MULTISPECIES: sodium:proton antiporter [Dyella]SFE27852.1 monovalent cation:H+ antiporter, CPA1 family [Dyella marensis]